MHWEWSRKLLWFILLAFGSWITFVSCNALGVTLYIGIGNRTMDKKTVSYTYFHRWYLILIKGWKILTTTVNHSSKLGTILANWYNHSIQGLMIHGRSMEGTRWACESRIQVRNRDYQTTMINVHTSCYYAMLCFALQGVVPELSFLP